VFSQRRHRARQTDRPELLKALEYARSGDVIVAWKLDRFGEVNASAHRHDGNAERAWHCSGKPHRENRHRECSRETDFRNFRVSCRSSSALLRGSMQVFRLLGKEEVKAADHEWGQTSSPMRLRFSGPRRFLPPADCVTSREERARPGLEYPGGCKRGRHQGVVCVTPNSD